MELMIYSPAENEKLPEIQWNFEEIKAYAAQKAAYYQSIAYTDADVKDMKSDKADINKFITALEDVRKQKKREYMAPYEVFESQIKETLLPLRNTVSLITNKLNEVEEQYRDSRKAKMEEFYQQYVGDLKEIVPFEKTIKEEFYKRAFTDKKLELAYERFFERIREDMKGLEQLPERFRDNALLKYMECYSLSDALQEGKRLEELEKLVEERRRQQEEARLVEESKKLLKEKEAKKPVIQAPEEPKQEAKTEELHQMDFRVWGTKEQILGLRQYLIDNKIKFGKVE